ncbi:V-type ATP synthase subunit I [Candidatus Woesearchaeota archaeon]|nr:V-type ATP synthase subunit I [Candidatus Woesearchaeota archaeon]
MINDMTKLRLVGSKAVMPKIIARLQELKILHIVEGQNEAEKGSSLPDAELLSSTLVKIRAIASKFNIPLRKEHAAQKGSVKGIAKEIEALAQKLIKIADEEKESNDILRKQQDHLEKAKILKALKLDLDAFQEYSTLSYTVGFIKNIEAFEAKLKEKTTKYSLRKAIIEKKAVIALFIDSSFFDSAKSMLTAHDFISIDFSDMKQSSEKRIKETVAKAQSNLKGIGRKRINLKKEYAKKLPDYEFLLSNELEKAEAPLRFQETDKAFVVWGFVPKEDIEHSIKELRNAANDRLVVEIHAIDKKDKVPIELENQKGVNSFQFFLDLYTLPKYKEIDPTWFMFITFPLLFGFMLGDYGYGLTTLVLFWFMKKAMPQFKRFFNILIFASFGTIFFGLIFGEFFGYEFWHPLISRNPHHALEPLMIAALFAGVIHVNAGLIAGFINEFRAHGFMTAFYEKFGWIFLQASVALLALSYTKVILLLPIVGWIVLALSLFMLYKGEGVRGLVEIPSIFGNILSYLRLMAIGLSSVGLALVINDQAAPLFAAGGLGYVWGALLLIVGHIINIGIGMLGSFLHSLRLHYVELFSKFYKGGGIRFKPFGYKEG